MQQPSAKLYGRLVKMTTLERRVLDRDLPENIALLGVKGVGKTTFINQAFDEEKRKKYYQKGNVIVARVSAAGFTDNMKSLYSHLCEAVFNGIEIIEEYNSEIYDGLMDKIEAQKRKIQSRSMEIDEAVMDTYLKVIITCVREAGFKILLVFDDFERFADSSKLKNEQYKYMRALANSGAISLFISTGKDLTKVSEEMKGSGFENIFVYEELRGIAEQWIEEWIEDVADEHDIEFDFDTIDWIIDVSGGIPEIVKAAIESCVELIQQKIMFEEDKYFAKLYAKTEWLFKNWWNYTENEEHKLLQDVVLGTAVTSNKIGDLVKKGYLNTAERIVTPLFSKYIIERLEQENESCEAKATQEQGVEHKIDGLVAGMQEMISKISGMDEKLVAIMGMPERNDYYNQTGELDFTRYKDDIQNYIAERLATPDETEICLAWNIAPEDWANLTAIRKSDCSGAYQLNSLIYNTDIQNMDYTPVIVMLANFLEGMLNDTLLAAWKEKIPLISVKDIRGNLVAMANCNDGMTIGGFRHVLGTQNGHNALANLSKPGVQSLNNQRIDTFLNMLNKCYPIRNKADHPGSIITYSEKTKFIKNMFLQPDSMTDIMLDIKKSI